MSTAWIIGAGPAGLMAADVLSGAGVSVTLADQMPSVGRKFLMAGKSGLNLTKTNGDFGAVFDGVMARAVADFGAKDVMGWAEALGQDLFTGSTGRVFPKAMKASPLLRAWMARLQAQGVTLRTRWCCRGWDGDALAFDTPEGPQTVTPDATVLALGGGSWRRLGSDGRWSEWITDVAPFQSANMGFDMRWSEHMRPYFGRPIKNLRLIAGDCVSRGEIVISDRGIEGGGIYEVSAALRDGAALMLDLLPDMSPEDVVRRATKRRAKASVSHVLKQTMKLPPVKAALVQEFARRADLSDPAGLAAVLKALPVTHAGPRPLDEAISTAGGLRFGGLTEDLMLAARPGVFAAGEMLDWEAPTGGYLITGCLASGRRAGMGALRYLHDAR